MQTGRECKLFVGGQSARNLVPDCQETKIINKLPLQTLLSET